MIIWLSGPTSAGKTTFSRSLRASGYSVVEENVPDKLFKAFVSEPKENCASLQRQIMQARFDGWRRVSEASRIAFDRSIDEDVEVFCKMHCQAKRLTQDEFEALAEFGTNLSEQLPDPDLIFYLTSSQDVLLRRMHIRPYPSLLIDGLGHQLSLYDEWLQNRSGEITKLDTSRLSEETLARFFTEICSC